MVTMNKERRRKISAGVKRHIKLTAPECRCYVHRSKNEGMTPEIRAKIGAANAKALKGKKLGLAHRNAVSRGLLGHPVNDETKQKISAAQSGRPRPPGSGNFKPHSEETKRKLSERMKEHAAQDLDCGCWVHSPNAASVSSLTWKLSDFLVGAGFETVIPEARIGRHIIDVLLGDEWIAFEADGKYWHDPKKDLKRDNELQEKFQLPVVRISEEEIATWT